MAEEIEVKAEVIPATEAELKFISQAQKQIHTAYDDRQLISMIASQIALPKSAPDVKVNLADVMNVIRLSVSMGLDPILGGIWAFKDKDGRLVTSVSKKGWQQAVASQKNCAGISFKDNGVLLKKVVNRIVGNKTLKKEVLYYESTTCVVQKKLADGSVCSFEGTAYHDEEFDASKPTWLQRPKRMLQSRAMTIAISNAYGWGAYDKEEFEELLVSQDIRTEKATVAVEDSTNQNQEDLLLENKTTKEDLIEQMNRAVTRKELVAVFKKAPKELQEDQEIIELGKQLRTNIKEQ